MRRANDTGLCSVELHRRERLEYLNYDLSDPLDLAIWTAVQTYVAYLETADLEAAADEPGGVRVGRSTIYDAGGVESLTLRPPFELENFMLRLRDEGVGETEAMGDDERFSTALRVLECLSLPTRDSSGKLLGYGDGEYRVQRNFFDAGEKLLTDSPGEKAAVSTEPPVYFPERVAPLYALLVRRLGPLVSQSEAARRIGITPRGMALRIGRKGIRQVRVGQYVFIREQDLDRVGLVREGREGG